MDSIDPSKLFMLEYCPCTRHEVQAGSNGMLSFVSGILQQDGIERKPEPLPAMLQRALTTSLVLVDSGGQDLVDGAGCWIPVRIMRRYWCWRVMRLGMMIPTKSLSFPAWKPPS